VTCGSNEVNLGSFNVTASTAISITGFTPGIGSPGTSVTISGTNFQTNPANDKVGFNYAPAAVSSATSTSITAIVPSNATSGHIFVDTHYSQAFSANSFYVPPSGVSSSNVVTGQMTIGGSSVTSTLSTAGNVGLYTFYGTGGQQISLNITNESFNGSNWADFSIVAPGGSTIASLRAWQSDNIIAQVNLRTTGSYTVVVAPEGTNTGSVTLQLLNTAEVNGGTISIGGSAVNVPTANPGQYTALTFSGTAAEQISLNITNESFNGSNWADFYILPPGGTIASPTASLRAWTASNIISNVILPTTGTYTVVVAPEGYNTGTVTLQLFDTAPVNGGTISIGGSAVNVASANPGQYTDLTFSGTAGAQISLNITNESFNGSNWADFYIVPPGGTIASPTASLRNWVSTNIIANVILPSTGTYTIVVAPEGYNTGTVTLQLFDTAEQTGTISLGGPPVNVTSPTPGQYTALTFSGTAGQQVSLYITNESFGGSNWADFYIVPPGGTISSPTASLRAWVPVSIIPNITLPTTGTYTVVVAPEGNNVGSVTLQLFDLSSGNLPVRGTFSDGNPNGTSISLTLPSSIQPGDISVVGIVSASTDATFTPPTGWTTLLNAGSNGVFYRIYQTGDSTTIAFTASESNWLTAQGITYTGVDQTNPIDSFNSWIFQGNGTTSPGYSRAHSQPQLQR